MQPRHRPAQVDQLLTQPLRIAGLGIALQVLPQVVAGTGQIFQLQIGQAAIPQRVGPLPSLLHISRPKRLLRLSYTLFCS